MPFKLGSIMQKFLIFTALFCCLFFNVVLVQAEDSNAGVVQTRDGVTPATEDTQEVKFLKGQVEDNLNPGKFTEVTQVLNLATNLYVMMAGSAALVLYIYAGYLWMTASGNAEKVNKSKATLIWTTFGVAAMLGSYFLLNIIFSWIYKAAPTTVQ